MERKGVTAPRLQVEMLRPKSIEAGGGECLKPLFLLVELPNHFLFWIKKKGSIPGPVHLYLWQGAQPSSPRPSQACTVLGLLLGPEGPRAVGLCRVAGPEARWGGCVAEQLPRIPAAAGFLSNPVNTPL